VLDSHDFLVNLALVLSVAALTSLVFQRLRLPVVFGYLVAGMIVGPNIPVPLVANQQMVRTLAELGVILLMFSIGLEFSFKRLLQVGGAAGIAAITETSVMMGLGYLAGQLLGFTTIESVFLAAIVAISSTTIIVKAFAEQGIRGRVADIVLGILIFEDLIAILLVAILTAVGQGEGLSPRQVVATTLRLVLFLAGLLGAGLLIVPRLIRAAVRIERAETILVASMGICFAASLLALSLGYSVALGAFIAGALVAESGQEKAVEHLVTPVRDLFVAIFFVAVGMLLDPMVIVEYWWIILVLVAIVIVGKVLAVSSGVFLTGEGLRPAVQAGMSLAQIGEFSFIIASVGLATDSISESIYPIAVAVSAITTLTTPALIKSARRVAAIVDAQLPGPLQTFTALYGSWLEGLRTAPRPSGRRRRTRRLVRSIAIDTVVLAVLFIGLSVEFPRLTCVARRNRWAVPAGGARRRHRRSGGSGGTAGGVSCAHDAPPWSRDRRAGAPGSRGTQGGHGSSATSRARGDAAVRDPVRCRRVAGGRHATVRAKHPGPGRGARRRDHPRPRRLAECEEPAGTRTRWR
jgi:CPA2 family monovalent cation:H+ antiporter-2